jgi:hypothetical protein
MLHLLNLCGSQGATSGNADTQKAQKEKERKNQNYNNACRDPGFSFLLSQFCDIGFRVYHKP